MEIAYLVPEFPGQTHVFFWRERAALKKLGILTRLVSTRRPAQAIVSHEWANQAESETFYLTDIRLRQVIRIGIEFFRISPKAWVRAVKVGFEGCPSLKTLFINFVLMLFAVHLISFMRRNNLNHIHCHSCANSALVAMFANRLAKISYSLTLHGDLSDYGRQQSVKWRYAAFGITITRRLFKEVHQQLCNDLPPQMGIAPMGVDVDVFKRTTAYKPWNREGPLRLFSCGRLNHVKGHHDLICAVSILKNAGMDVYLEIAGEDEIGGSGFHKALESLILNLELIGTVVLLGAVSEQRVLEGLKSAHVFVLASHHEPLGVAIMEALSCETPVIATSSGGVPELIDHGFDGYLISPHDPQEIAEAIKYLAKNPTLAEQFSRSGRSKISRRFNSNLSAIELKGLLQRM